MSTDKTLVTTSLRLFAGSDGSPVYIASEGGRDAELNVSGRFDAMAVDIHDVRTATELSELDVRGFTGAGGLNPVPDFRSAGYAGECKAQAQHRDADDCVFLILRGPPIAVPVQVRIHTNDGTSACRTGPRCCGNPGTTSIPG